MFAGHFAMGLAIKGSEPKAPMWAVMVAVFLPDLIWLVLSIAGIEQVEPATAWFDGWSHSVLFILLQASVFMALFWCRGRRIAIALGLAVASHLLLDLPMHPARLELYPHAALSVGNFLHGWARIPLALGKTNGWWFEMSVVAILLALSLVISRQRGPKPRIVLASGLLICGLQLFLA